MLLSVAIDPIRVVATNELRAVAVGAVDTR